MKKILALILALVCLLAVCSGCKKEEPSPYLKGKHHVEIEVQDYGTIALELDADTAPITVTNFIELAKNGFYDGLTFHRIIEGFMIQGGDPLGNGTGGSENPIKGEFEANGVKNKISHKRGVISMARRSGDNNSASGRGLRRLRPRHLRHRGGGRHRGEHPGAG